MQEANIPSHQVLLPPLSLLNRLQAPADATPRVPHHSGGDQVVLRRSTLREPALRCRTENQWEHR